MPLPRTFFARPTLEVARDLVGMRVVHEVRGARTAGVIVETEAYIGEDDPACHAAPGPTARNAPLYGAPGVAYVYLNYGLHHLVNAVTEAKGSPAAVLIRALEPVDGLALMRRRRAGAKWRQGKPLPDDFELCRGPGNLTVALGITTAQNTTPLTRRPLLIHDDRATTRKVIWTPRIGIRVGTDRQWRCSVVASPAVSGPRLRPTV
jgi:DNA-3-methyladenine glycosylase